MNIVINAVLSFEEPRGVGRYINNLLPTIAELDKENQYYVYYGSWMKSYSFCKIHQENFHMIEIGVKNTQVIRNLYLSIVLPLKCKKFNPNLFFLIDTQAILVKPCTTISTIHDLAEFVLKDKYTKLQGFLRRKIVGHQIKISDEILTVSNYSKQDIIRRFKVEDKKVHVTYNAVDISQNMISLQEPEDYFLFVSETEYTKNFRALLYAYDMLSTKEKEKYHIKVVGKRGNDYENIIKIIEDKGLTNKIEFLGFVNDQQLDMLYAKAYAFVFPSFFEGFGLPVLEAMAKGTPVLCSNTSSIPEVGGKAVLTFDPQRPEDLCEQMQNLIKDCNLRKKMIAEGFEQAGQFTKLRAAERTLNVLNKYNKM